MSAALIPNVMPWHVIGQGVGAPVVAAFVCPEDAAAFVAILGDGATVNCRGKRLVWTEGAESESAGESYDRTADTMVKRARGIL